MGLKFAKKCVYCSISFENWVSGKIMNHVGNHIESGDKEVDE